MKDSDLEKARPPQPSSRGLFLGAAAATTAGLDVGRAQAASPTPSEASGGYRGNRARPPLLRVGGRLVAKNGQSYQQKLR